MNQIIVKASLIALFSISITMIFYSSTIKTRSYNIEETYWEPLADGGKLERQRTVLITENNYVNGYMIAFGIVAGAALISLVLCLNNENNSVDK